MLVRFVLFVLGAGLLGGGGWLAWLKRDATPEMFPPPAGLDFWLLIGALLLVCAGLVLLGAAVIPRPKRAARLAAEAARRKQVIADADSFYARRARAANSDWRTGDLPAPSQTPVTPPPAEPEHVPDPVFTPEPRVEPQPAEPERLEAEPAALQPDATPDHATPQTAQPAPLQTTPDTTELDAIRRLLDAGQLDEAETQLDAARNLLLAAGPAARAQLAELTGLAGEHAAAAGRPGNAKWLWRLALRRFGEAGAAQSPAARRIADLLRRIDQE